MDIGAPGCAWPAGLNTLGLPGNFAVGARLEFSLRFAELAGKSKNDKAIKMIAKRPTPKFRFISFYSPWGQGSMFSSLKSVGLQTRNSKKSFKGEGR
jgi:hypothetical protein